MSLLVNEILLALKVPIVTAFIWEKTLKFGFKSCWMKLARNAIENLTEWKCQKFWFLSAVCADVGGRCQNQWHRLDSTTSRVLSVMIVPCALRAMCALCVGSRQMNLGQFTIIRFWSSVDVVSDQRNVRMHMQHVIQKTDFFSYTMKKLSAKWCKRIIRSLFRCLSACFPKMSCGCILLSGFLILRCSFLCLFEPRTNLFNVCLQSQFLDFNVWLLSLSCNRVPSYMVALNSLALDML